MEKVLISCLKRENHSSNSFRLVPLDTKNEVVFGRSPEATCCLWSAMISRKHAILQKSGDGWTIMDNKSLNGVFVNDVKLDPLVPHAVQDGDLIRLGVPPAPDKPPEFMWRFHKKLKVKKKLGPRKQQSQGASSQHSDVNCSQATTASNLSKPAKGQKRKSDASPECSRGSPMKKPCHWSPSEELARKLAEQERVAAERLAEQEARLAELQKRLMEKDAAQHRMEAELREKEAAMKAELQKEKDELEENRQKFEEEMKQTYEEQLREKEEMLKQKLSSEKQSLLDEKRKIEDSLKKEIENKLEKKNKDLEAQLLREKEKLEKVIEKKELEQKLLESELSNVKSENEKQKDSVLRTKEEILGNFTNLMESELQCSICNELFVQATSLNCSHSFCALCIEQWLAVKAECPVCRAPVASHLRSLVLDSYIDSMVQHLSGELRERRAALVAERRDEMQKRDAARNAPRGRGRGRGGRNRTRGGRNNRLLMAGNNAPRLAQPAEANHGGVIVGVIEVEDGENGEVVVQEDVDNVISVISDDDSDSDDSDDSDSEADSLLEAMRIPDAMSDPISDLDNRPSLEVDSDDSLSSMEGVPGSYYGGYGTCFTCGRRGHWRPGCPFKDD